MRIVAECDARIKVGSQFEGWTVIGPGFVVPSPSGEKRMHYVAQCQCGAFGVVLECALLRNGHRSCGCLPRKNQRRYQRKPRNNRGLSREPLYNRWRGILDRCYRPKSTRFKNYGARGITVCDEWKSYKTFKEWAIEAGFQENLSIDRIDVNGPYSPSNCRWVTSKCQQRNRRNNRFVQAFGETKVGIEWCEDARCIVPVNIFWNRLHQGWSAEDAMTKPISYRQPRKPRKQTQDGR